MLDFEDDLNEIRDRIEQLDRKALQNPNSGVTQELSVLRLELEARTADVYSNLTPWQRVQLARHQERPHTLDYIDRLFPDFVELHGDRRFGDDPSVVAGLASFDNISVVVVGHQKGRTTAENLERNFGMARPEGFRKALRIFGLAETFNRPVFTFLDTPGASPTLEDEERGQSWAIAENMGTLARLRVPVITTVIGEGGSGGALALGIGDRVLMMEHSIYSVASPEAAAAIVWRDSKYAEKAAAALRLTSADLLHAGLIDRVVPEPEGGAHRDHNAAAENLGEELRTTLKELRKQDIDTLVESRYDKYREMGEFAHHETSATG
ncbi:MAG: acetyl-CoA carboxylase carboxyl transferase subunit alpha [Chloroflexi bacterium]|nr:acetyl-CoA carboxylase carboxyl transferase subunit alpha [Chloroflexota bacterium]HCU72757.1 acetyl-CoA carboxylase carboxyl transferase subunit alpha [Chloroflexota bacterium]|tara:strand:- start:18252 stop:19220 length:969 start_codon:yes stop_codon:yes gene_type:complete